jgi:PIN domain nuclease of toxin-antitoxin system
MKNSFLLDTQTFLWVMEGNARLSLKTMDRIEQVIQRDGKIYISAVSIWEIGKLNTQGSISLTMPCLQWVQEALQAPYVYLAPLSPEIAIESNQLPGFLSPDFVTCILIATARVYQVPLLTRDQEILDYAAQGHLESYIA